jgi:hypothetical protein
MADSPTATATTVLAGGFDAVAREPVARAERPLLPKADTENSRHRSIPEIEAMASSVAHDTTTNTVHVYGVGQYNSFHPIGRSIDYEL